MADQIIKLKCKTCGQERFRSRTIVYQKTSGNCMSCASTGNQRRYLGKPYSKLLYNTPLYSSWYNIKTRCTNKNSPSYKDYGGRGITICKEWLTFSGFIKDMQNTHTEGLSIERINNNGNYSKENCRWATPKEQANNRRSSRVLLFNGEKKTIAQWSDLLGIKRTTISQRIDYYGWNVMRALST